MGSILPTFHSQGKVHYCRTWSHHSFQRRLYHQRLEEDWYKCEIDSEFLMRMTHCRETRASMQTISHPLDMEIVCKIWFPHWNRRKVYRRGLEGDWCKFFVDLERHLHMSENMSPTLRTMTILRRLDMVEYCRVVFHCSRQHSIFHRFSVVGWCMFWSGFVFRHHKKRSKG